jgi:hypothetical protein
LLPGARFRPYEWIGMTRLMAQPAAFLQAPFLSGDQNFFALWSTLAFQAGLETSSALIQSHGVGAFHEKLFLRLFSIGIADDSMAGTLTWAIRHQQLCRRLIDDDCLAHGFPLLTVHNGPFAIRRAAAAPLNGSE